MVRLLRLDLEAVLQRLDGVAAERLEVFVGPLFAEPVVHGRADHADGRAGEDAGSAPSSTSPSRSAKTRVIWPPRYLVNA